LVVRGFGIGLSRGFKKRFTGTAEKAQGTNDPGGHGRERTMFRDIRSLASGSGRRKVGGGETKVAKGGLFGPRGKWRSKHGAKRAGVTHKTGLIRDAQ